MNNPFQEITERLENIERILTFQNTEKQTPSEPIKEILNVDDLMSLTGYARQTIYGLVNEGKIPYYKMGRYLRFKRPEILKWITQNHAS